MQKRSAFLTTALVLSLTGCGYKPPSVGFDAASATPIDAASGVAR